MAERRDRFVFCGALALPAIAMAGAALGGTFQPPAGCAAYLTVQASNCVVEHFWTCETDPAGRQWNAEQDQQGTTYVGQIDAEAQWIESFFVPFGEREYLSPPAADPASLTTLLETGLDTYDFTLETATGPRNVRGYDRIADRDVLIDGEPLHRTEFEIVMTDAQGQVLFDAAGSEYVSERHRRFFSGQGRVNGPGAPYAYNEAPVEFIYPGEPGFLSNQPVFGCDALTASLTTQRKDQEP